MAWINTIVCVEKWNSRSSSVNLDKTKNEVEFSFYVLGTEEDVLVRAAVENTLPVLYLGLWLHGYKFDYKGGWVWEGTAHYSLDAPKMPEGQKNPGGNQPDKNGNVPTMKFDTSGGKQKITSARDSLAQAKTFTALGSAPPPDWHRIIGWDGEKLEGTEIVIPQYTWEETHYFNYLAMTAAYRRVLFTLTSTINNKKFRGLHAQEVLFLGASGSVKGLENWEITFKFAASPRAKKEDGTMFRLGDVLNIEKEGWDHLWIRYHDVIIENRKIPQPQHVVIQQVYGIANFDLLGIGSF